VAKLYVARHGQASDPDDLRLPGPDLPLLERGYAQARALGERFRPLAPATVYTSDALRAWQTATVIAECCSVALTILPALRELDFGAWSGQTFAEIVADQPAAAGYFMDSGTGSPPDGEPVATAAARVFDALRQVAEAHRSQPVIVIGHAGSLRLALVRALGMPLAAYWRLRLDYAGLSVLDWTESGVIIKRLNDVSHLEACHASGARVPT
jgi:broad specificity phosphatase PhoE